MGGIKWIRAYPVQSGVDSFKPSTQADIKWNRGEGKAQIVYQPSPEDQSAFSQDGKKDILPSHWSNRPTNEKLENYNFLNQFI